MPKVSDEHKDAVRRRIIDAAVVCLARNDYQDVTTRELLTEAGLSTGTFYNYFTSKEHLYEAIAEELLSEDVGRILAEGTPTGQTGPSLLSLIRDYMLADPRSSIAVANFRSRTTGNEAMAAISRLNAWIVEEFTPLVATAQTEGFVRSDIDPRALVELLDLVWHGLGHRSAQHAFQTSFDEVGHALLQVLMGGILAAAPDPEQPIELSPQPVPAPTRPWPI